MKLAKRSTWQRVMVLLLSFMLAVSTLPVPALAESVAEGTLGETQTEQPEAQQGQDEADAQQSEPAAQEGEQAEPADPQEETKPTQEPATPAAGEQGAQEQDTEEQGEDKKPEADSEESSEDENEVTAQAVDVTVTVRVIGPGTYGDDTEWLAATTYQGTSEQFAWDAVKTVLDDAGLTYDFTEASWGVSLDAIASPATGEKVAMTSDWSKYWGFYVGNKAADNGLSSEPLVDNLAITLKYGPYSPTLDADGVEPVVPANITVDPNAPRPSYSAFWAGFRGAENAGQTGVQLPAAPGKLTWEANLKGASMYVNMSDPIIVNNNVYIAVGNEMHILDGATGEVLQTAPLAASINYASRIVYADGVVMVPLSGGRVQALTADTLTTVWLTDEVPSGADQTQSMGTGVVHDGIAYFQTVRMDGYTSVGGYILALNVADGSLAWYHENTSAGYYWAAPAFLDGAMVIADESGTVTAYDAKTGKVLSSVSLGGAVRSGVALSSDGSALYVVTRDDGTLHKITVAPTLGAGGKLKKAASVKFAAYSTSTPTVADGKIFVGGREADPYGEDDWGGKLYAGTLAVIDESTFMVKKKITTAKQKDGETSDNLPAEVKASPLVSTADGTHVYFTSNLNPGALYVYTDGDDEAAVLYEPEADLQQYCLYTPIPTADGGVVYANDSGHIFKVIQGEQPGPTPPPDPGGDPEPAATTPTPQMVTNAGDKVVKRTATVTYAMAVRVPDDATEVELKHTMEPPLVFASKEDELQVSVYQSQDTIDPSLYDVALDGKTITVTLREAAKSTKENGAKELVAASVDDLKGNMILVVFKAKLDKNPDLEAYLNEDKTVATIPCVCTSTINGDPSRVKTSKEKTVKYSTKTASDSEDDDDNGNGNGNSKKPTRNPSSSSSSSRTTRTRTPKTGDPTSTVLPIVIGVIAVVGVGAGVVLKRRGKDKEE